MPNGAEAEKVRELARMLTEAREARRGAEEIARLSRELRAAKQAEASARRGLIGLPPGVPVPSRPIVRRRQVQITPRAPVVVGPMPPPPRQPWEMTRAEFLDEEEMNRRLYEAAAQRGSNLDAPIDLPIPPVGSWRLDKSTGGWSDYGSTIEQLREVPVNLVAGVESPLTEGRAEYVYRYRDWLLAGHEPPPIRAALTQSGEYRIMDGHRRLEAARMAGRTTIKAWVSDWADTGLRTPEGEIIDTDRTWETSIRDALAAGRPVPAPVLAEFRAWEKARAFRKMVDRIHIENAQRGIRMLEAAGEARVVVFRHPTSTEYNVLHPSTRIPGRWQLSFIGNDGIPHGHEEYPTREAAIHSMAGIPGSQGEGYTLPAGGKGWEVTETK